MRAGSLSHRLSAVLAALLLTCCSVGIALQVRSAWRHERDVAQRLSLGLAQNIADHFTLMSPDGSVNATAVEALFHRLMEVNPSVEVYLLGLDGRVLAEAAPPGHLKRGRVDLGPVQRLVAGEPPPILGDDPRDEAGQKVFSAAPVRLNGREAGYVYVVLLGEAYDALSRDAALDAALQATGATMALAALLCLLVGLAAFAWITRPLRRLTEQVNQFDPDDSTVLDEALAMGPADAHPPAHDEIASLDRAFARLRRRIAEQWRELNAQDQQRRELVANISHDLRTPLTSLHGYLETLRVKSEALSQADRLRYLDVALSQSEKVGRLAQELFELARLEHGVVKPHRERFSLADLVQDVFQKFELAAEARRQHLVADIAPELPVVHADLGLIERVLANLLDNAIRHTPPGGSICVRLRSAGRRGVEVQVRDSGPGIPQAMQPALFTRPLLSARGREGSGGLGLVIVRRILQLHGSDIRLMPAVGEGAVFRFCLSDLHESLNSA
ncbi:ATP-binding protein [Ideonella sp. DXS29W]|uniref:histidine kinase n=1 Tax=Ideonella lacteola TaxID=2984193 RepID=A0ABU9BML1_9BURK